MDSFVELSGVRIFYEEHGVGDAVLLLHGGMGGAGVLSAQAHALAEHYRVLAPDQRGRGRTPDPAGPVTYQVLTDDMVAFLTEVVREPAHLVGISDGGIVGLTIGMQRPELLRRLVVLGANFHRDGLVEGTMWTELPPHDPSWAFARERYEATSPDGPDHWPVIFEKMQTMWRQEPTMTERDVAGIRVPTLVISGDDDAVALPHTTALYEAIPDGQLAVIPGTSHAMFLEKPDLVNRLIIDFLAEEGPPETLLPIRRAPSG